MDPPTLWIILALAGLGAKRYQEIQNPKLARRLLCCLRPQDPPWAFARDFLELTHVKRQADNNKGIYGNVGYFLNGSVTNLRGTTTRPVCHKPCPAMPSSLKQASTLSNDNNSSDYGSDFSTDEEELLNDLLARVAASNTTFPPPTSTATAAVAATAVVESGSQAAVEENSSGSQATAVPDIEDYDPLHFSRVPKVLGRETWNSQQRWRQQQQRQINSTTLRRTAQRSDPVARDSSIPVICTLLLHSAWEMFYFCDQFW